MAEQIIISRAQLDALKATLGNVTSVAKAWAAISATRAMANEARAQILPAGGLTFDPWRKAAAKQISDSLISLDNAAKVIGGKDTDPVSAQTWAPIRSYAYNVWILAHLAKGQFPAENMAAADRYLDFLVRSMSALPGQIANAPAAILTAAGKVVQTTTTAAAKTVKQATSGVANIVGAAVGGAADIAGNAAKPILELTWPVLLLVGGIVVIVGYVALRNDGAVLKNVLSVKTGGL